MSNHETIISTFSMGFTYLTSVWGKCEEKGKEDKKVDTHMY